MKNQHPKHEGNGGKFSGSRSNSMKKKKNMRRMGGQGLSLEAFANAKSNSSYFNPALIKKQKEFYKNSKYVNKYKKSLKQQQSNPPLAISRFEEEMETEDGKRESETGYVSKKENETECGSKMENGAGDSSEKENETECGSKMENGAGDSSEKENKTECGSKMENGDGDSSEKENETGGGRKMSKNDKKKKKYGARSIMKMYEMKHEDERRREWRGRRLFRQRRKNEERRKHEGSLLGRRCLRKRIKVSLL